ncbi:MAG: aldo/keto reductase [Solirubrobacterales bacterium]
MTFTIGGEFGVNRIGLGTNRIEDDGESRAILAAAVERGVNFIDTADIYTGGESEQVIGETIGERQDVVVATKGGYHGAEPDVMAKAIEASRARLRCDVIDLYYLHRPDPRVQFEKSLEPIIAARDAGRIRHIGVSNVTLTQLRSARMLTPIAAVQNEYSLDHPDDHGVIDYCTEHAIAFVPFFPMRGSKAAGRIAEELGITRHQVVLAAMLRRSPVVAPIPGTRSIKHLEENLAAAKLELRDEHLAELGFA